VHDPEKVYARAHASEAGLKFKYFLKNIGAIVIDRSDKTEQEKGLKKLYAREEIDQAILELAGTPKIRHRVSPGDILKVYGKRIPIAHSRAKREIIGRIKEKGERVADLAKEYGVQPRIIYGYLSRSSQNSGNLLELAKIKREK
jgi:hypothetical protein